MAKTVLGFFDNSSDAQRAVEKLQTIGLSRDKVDISSRAGATYEQSDVSDTEKENGITRFFKSLFGSDEEADRYRKVSENCTIVTVHAESDDQAERAADILDESGAINVDERAEQYGYTRTSGPSRGNKRQATSIPKVEENLQVGKREVERGGVRVRSRIVERPVEEHIRLREENVHVERQPVNRPATEGDLSNLRDRNIELTERSEVPVVNKEARVTEEVQVSKDVNERTETIRDTVRNTEIDVDKKQPEDRNTRGSSPGREI